MNAQEIIDKLMLIPHPEGGYYKETYRSADCSTFKDLFFQNEIRRYATGIYFMLMNENFSAWHRIKSDEMWHYYAGTESLLVHEIDTEGNYRITELNNTFNDNFEPQYVVKAGNWFASEIKNQNGFALVGCTVSPGFDFKDFELAERETLSNMYPQHRAAVKRLTR
jgi:hypothetical protein